MLFHKVKEREAFPSEDAAQESLKGKISSAKHIIYKTDASPENPYEVIKIKKWLWRKPEFFGSYRGKIHGPMVERLREII